MSYFAMYGKLVAKPGQRNALAKILVEAGEYLKANDDCMLYIVNLAEDDPDTIWVTELWKDRESHAASREDEPVKTLIGRGRPLVAGGGSIRLNPVGGKGV